MLKNTRFADSPLLDAMRDAARAVDEFKRSSCPGLARADALWLVAVTAQPCMRAALRAAFPA